MASEDILRYIDSLARDKEIDKDELFESIEQAVAAALAKKYGIEDLEITLNRETGSWDSNYEISLEQEGRILAQAVKQSINVKVREAERDRLYDEYEMRIGEIVNGTVQRFEGDTVIVNLGNNMEGILPRAEKVRGEAYNIGDRIRAMVLEVKKVGTRVKVILSLLLNILDKEALLFPAWLAHQVAPGGASTTRPFLVSMLADGGTAGWRSV